MNSPLPALLALLVASLFPSAVFASELPDYIRYAEDEQSARLEVAVKSFTLPSGQTVDLIGAVHIADPAYYQELNRRFESYDSVLFELVGDPRALTQVPPQQQASRPGSTVSFIQQAAGQHLHLVFQLGAIDYTRNNMVHADASQAQFARMEQERGENVLTLFVSAMQAQMNSDANRASMQELDTFALIRILMSPDSAMEFKKALARNFDRMEFMTAAMEGPRGSAVLSGRNGVLLERAKQVLANRKQRRIAVFYGAAHMPGIEALLLTDLKARGSGEEWLAAWTMPNSGATQPPADKTPAHGTAKPAS